MSKLPDGMAQRQVIMTTEMAKWFRGHAFHTDISQQEHFRSALSEYRDRIEREAGKAPDDIERGLALVQRFAAGDGVDLELLRDPDRPSGSCRE